MNGLSTVSPHERFRSAREARRQDTGEIARRIGVRLELLQAIDEGRFSDLPTGLYGRFAIKAYAADLGLDVAAILTECEPLLSPVEDPIAALARLRGLRPHASAPVAAKRAAPDMPAVISRLPFDGATPPWRTAAAAAIDAVAIASLEVTAFGATLLFCRTGPSALGTGAAPAFAVFGLLLAVWYFVYFGGIAGQTPGERAMRIPAPATSASKDLRSIGQRALRCALREVSLIHLGGQQLGAFTARPGDADRDVQGRGPHAHVHAITEL